MGSLNKDRHTADHSACVMYHYICRFTPLTKYHIFTYAAFAIFQLAEVPSAMTGHGEEAAGL